VVARSTACWGTHSFATPTGLDVDGTAGAIFFFTGDWANAGAPSEKAQWTY